MNVTRIFPALAASVLLFASAPAAHAAKPRISGINEAFFTEGTYMDMQDLADQMAGTDLQYLEMQAGGEVTIALPAALFLDQEGVSFSEATGQEYVTAAQLDSGKVKLQKKLTTGGDLSETVGFGSVPDPSRGRQGGILLRMVDPYVAVSERSFDYTLSLAVTGERHSQASFRLAGKMTFETQTVHEGEVYADIQEGIVLEPEAYIRKIELDLGYGVSITTNLFKDKKYYGTASVEYYDEDFPLFEEYPQIEAVYTLHTVNLKSAVKNVRISWDSVAWVYGEDGAYLGRTDNALPYSDIYYLSGVRLPSLHIES